MPRPLLALFLVFALVGGALLAPAPTSAQPGVCLSLAPGEHSFTAPARDRDGEVTFTVTVAEGGAVTAFTEPGGQSIPPVTMLDIFTGEDAYPLPEGVSFVDCPGPSADDQDDAMQADDSSVSPSFCVSLEPGAHTETVSAGGRSYDVTVQVDDDRQIANVAILGRDYTAAEALQLLEGFGAALPETWDVRPCLSEYPTSGTGGLGDSTDRAGLWAVLASFAVLTISLIARNRRAQALARNSD